MKGFMWLCGLLLIIALAAPFLMTINGKRLMTVDDLVDQPTPAALTPQTSVYRWQDANGTWQFGDQPPEHASEVETVELEERMTELGAQWHGGSSSGTRKPTELPVPGIGGLLQGKRLMNQAQEQANNLSERANAMQHVLDDLNQRQ